MRYSLLSDISPLLRGKNAPNLQPQATPLGIFKRNRVSNVALTKWYKAGTAGETADGRKIEPQWIKDIVESYDRREREASIFLDHRTWYGNYGTVVGIRAAKDHKGRDCVELQSDVTPNMLDLNIGKQYMYPSLGIIPNYCGTGKAYLGHLGQVQDPASASVETIKYKSQEGEDEQEMLCFASAEPVTLELEPDTTGDKPPGWFTRFMKTFDSEQDTEMSNKALEALQTQLTQMQEQFSALAPAAAGNGKGGGESDEDKRFSALEAKIDALTKQFGKDKGDESDDKVKSLEIKLETFAKQLTDALAEQGSTATTDTTTGADGEEFSVV